MYGFDKNLESQIRRAVPCLHYKSFFGQKKDEKKQKIKIYRGENNTCNGLTRKY